MLSASLAHEVGNPLASIKTIVQVHLRDPGVENGAREVLETVVSEVDRLAAILARMTGFARRPVEPSVQVTARAIFNRVALLIDAEARNKGVELELLDESLSAVITVQSQKLEQVLLNLAVNALQAIEGPGKITISAHPGARGIEVAVRDTGPGIPEEMRSRIFDPFYTTKDGGTGLGLPIARQLVAEMGGKMRIEHPESGGVAVVIELRTGMAPSSGPSRARDGA